MDRDRGWSADRGRARGLGAPCLLDWPVPLTRLGVVEGRWADDWSNCGGDLLRLLGRQRAACGGAVEWWYQLRRRSCFPILFADLIVLPILNIYRKYYGLRM